MSKARLATRCLAGMFAFTASAVALAAIAAPRHVAAAHALQDDEAMAAAPEIRAEDVLMLRLRDGQIRWGMIEAHTPDGLTFMTLENGGRVEVPWLLLDPGQEFQLRERFGYVDVSSEEIFVETERLLLKGGGEVIGVIDPTSKASGDMFLVQREGNRQSIPKSRVAQVLDGPPVSVLEIYSREQYYVKLATGVDMGNPDALVELAQNCERILDFTNAAIHYAQALELDPEHGGGSTEAALAAAERKSQQQEQIEYLRNIDLQRRKGYFDRALALAEAFGTTYPDSPLIEDANKKRVTVLTARDRAITEETTRQWHRYVERFAGQAARTMTYGEAQTYAGEQLGEDVLAKVTEIVQAKISPDIQPENVREYWEKRKKGRYKLASYSHGSWLIGEDNVVKGLDGGQEEPELSGIEKERNSQQKKIEQYLKNREQALRARSGQDDGENMELFWEGWSPNSKAQWIRAYYVENSGDMEVRPRPRLSNCSECGGSGAREVIYTGGGGGNGGNPGSKIVRCPLCHGVQYVRKIYYR